MNIFKKLPQVAARVIATGALLVAASLPLMANTAGAASLGTITAYVSAITGGQVGANNPPTAFADSFAAGASGTITIGGAGFAYDGGTVTVTSNAPGVTFSSAREGSSAVATVNFTSSASSTTPGTYNLTLTDNAGTSTTLTNGFTVNALPTFTSLSSIVLPQGTGVLETVVGTGFDNSNNADLNAQSVTTVSFVSTVDGTKLNVGTAIGTAYNTANSFTGSPNAGSSSAFTFDVTAYGNLLQGVSTVGTYNMVITNSDGGSVIVPNALTVTAGGVSNVSPSDIVISAGAQPSKTASEISGSGFQPSASVQIGNTTAATGDTAIVSAIAAAVSHAVTYTTTGNNTTVVGQACYDSTDGNVGYVSTAGTLKTIICTFPVTTTSTSGPHKVQFGNAVFVPSNYTPTLISGYMYTGSTTGSETVTVTNPAIAAGGNGAVFAAANVFGIGTVVTTAPTITSVTAGTTAPGVAAGTTVTINGYGFDPTVTQVAAFLYNNAGAPAADAAVNGANNSCTVNTTGVPGTVVTCTVVAASGAFAGVDAVTVTPTGGSPSLAAANALTVSGPSMTSIAPTSIPVGSAIGTTFTITGTGFNNTAAGTISGPAGSGLAGVVSVQSATSAIVAITGKPTISGTASVTLSEYNSNGVVIQVAPLAVKITAAPAVVGSANAGWLVNHSAVHGTGAGSTNAAVIILSSGIVSGAKIGSFTNVNGTADTGVTGTFVSIDASGTKAVFALTIAASDTSISDGYTITNPDGGTVTVKAFSTGAITIDPAPVITSVTPTKGTGGGATTFVVNGNNFDTQYGQLIVYPLGTGLCGPTTIVTATTMTATCALANAGSAPVSIAVANYDGGLAVSAPVLAAVVPAVAPTKIPAFNVAFAKGSAVLSAAAKAALTTFVSSVTDGSSVTITAWGTTGALATARVAAIAFYISNASSSIGLHYTLAHGVNKTLNKGVVTETVAK